MTGEQLNRPLRRALAALEIDRRRVLLAVLAGTAALGCAIGLMAVSAWLIVRASQQPPVLVLQVAIVATRTFGIGRGVLRYLERLVSHDVALRGVSTIRQRLYSRLAAADPAVVAGLRPGDLLARVGADVDAIADVVVRGLLPFGVGLLTGMLSVTLLAFVLPGAALAVAAGLLVAGGLAPWLAAGGARRAEQAGVEARAALSEQTLAVLDGLDELTVAGAVPGALERVRALDGRLALALDAAARPAALAAGLATLATTGAALAALLIAVTDASLSPAMLAVVALTSVAAAEAVTGLPAAAVGLVRARAAAARVMDLLNAPAAPPQPRAELPAGPARVSAVDLSCGWPGHPPALTGIHLDLSPGRRIALTGPSGSGKTTLLLTLAGLLPARGGTLTPGPAALRQWVNLTAEDAHLFATTVRENLRVAGPRADDTELLAVLDRVRLGLGLGLDTLLESGGGNLSGGERRRLLLARALLSDAPILLLDEPAEHLDPATADALLQDLLTVPDRTVVVATHRLGAFAAADQVLVLREPAVIESGV